NTRFKTGISTEHSYRGDLQNLLESIATDVLITNEPTHIDCGAPDYILTKKNIPVGYIEAKDIGADLNSKNYKEQFDRYRASLSNLIFTDYLNFQLYRDGEFVLSIAIARIENNKIVGIPQKYEEFQNLIKDFAAHIGQTIKSAEKLSKMMAGKARMLASVIENALKNDDADLQNTAHEAENNSLRDQLTAFKQVLIHDITQKEFADIYAQTIAYGMFAARFHDPTLETFSRQEAAELIPKSNPFLRKLFQYVAGYDLDDRLKWIVEALVDIFRATDVAALLKNFGKATQQNDPIIHFYETFLGEYDPKLRKARGVWYTPEPVVNFIVRAVDDILKTEFGLPQGLADTCKIKIKQKIVTKATADQRSKLKEVEVEQEVHKVQILDPACGTGTFLAEIIKHIYKKFEGQQGIWSRYVDEHLIPRLNGFEILMASYAMAHLKLDLLLANTGYKPQKDQRFKIYLTNSLEEHHPDTGTLFANWLSSEANEANYVKRDTPVMVVLGNPPYSVSSSNKGEWIQNLIADYKKDLNEKKINLDDDYIKFIRYGQYLIDKNGEGILAYISNNSFIDGITHRRMRKHLLETFDKIYILDLHGSTKKNEVCLDGSKDENVFDIQQGVSINLFVKNNKKKKGELADVMHFDLFGTRVEKYNNLFENNLKEIKWNKLEYKEPYFFFVPKKINDLKYDSWFSITELFVNVNNGVKTDRDSLFIDERKLNIENRFKILLGVDIPQLFIDEYRVIDSGSFKITERIKAKKFNSEYIKPILYRPFDIRYIYYDPQIVSRPAQKVMQHMLKDNLALLSCRQQSTFDFQHILVSKVLSEVCTVSLQTKETTYVFPLYLYPETTGQQNTEQTAPPNLPKGEAKSQFTEQTDSEVPSIGGDLGGVRTPNLNKEIALKIARSIRYMYDPNDSSINFSYRDTGITLIA
ncbi:MAG: type ISP restriction/modification enzyme, partial [Bacteroidales bacterium]